MHGRDKSFIAFNDRNDIMQRKILRSAVRRADCGLHAERGDKQHEIYQALVDNLFVSIRMT